MGSPSPGDTARIDQWLWAVRLFKSRSLAAEAVRSGRVRIDGQAVKAARPVGAGDEITVRKGPITYRYRVLRPLSKRVGAPLVPEYCADVTPAEERDKLDAMRNLPTAFRERGSGRPTKRERRDLDRFRDAD